MNRLKNIFGVFYFSLCVLTARAQEPQNLFDQGVAAYAKADYTGALNAFKKIEGTGQKSYALFFNIGNVHYKQREYGQAMLYYQRCLKYYSSTPELDQNIALTQKQFIDKLPENPNSLIYQSWNNLVNALNNTQWGVVGLLLFGVTNLAFWFVWSAKHATARKKALLWSLLALFLCISINMLGFIQKEKHQSQHQGIILSPSVNVQSEPSEVSAQLFVIHEGVLVEIKQTQGEWLRIQLSDGKHGWCLKSALEVV